MASRKPVPSTQQQRHQLLRESVRSEGGGFIVEGETLTPTSRGGRQANGSKSSSSSAIASLPLPTDTSGAIDYLLELIRPHHVRQQKPFPRVCMVHQIYSLLQDHTTVDRTLAQMIKDGSIRKFYIGGTGSDEFAIMRTPDYVDQIMVAKEQYLKELTESSSSTSSSTTLASGSATKRKLPEDNMSGPRGVIGNSNKRSSIASCKPRRSGTMVSSGGGGGGGANRSSEVLQAELEHAGDLFDRFRNLVTSGQCIEISIQHSNLQEAIGATEEDITVLIRYSLLTRCLAVPANPHLINLNSATGRTAGGSATSGTGTTTGGSGHSALNQLINATNQEQSRAVKADVASSSAAASGSGSGPNAPTSVPTTTAAAASLNTISAASGRRERISDDVGYRFAIRQGGLFVTHFLKGRLEILRMVKRQMFGDMLTSAVIAKPLRGSFLPHEFHVHDLVGSGRVQSVSTTSGQLLKLTQKGEVSAKAGTNKS